MQSYEGWVRSSLAFSMTAGFAAMTFPAAAQPAPPAAPATESEPLIEPDDAVDLTSPPLDEPRQLAPARPPGHAIEPIDVERRYEPGATTDPRLDEHDAEEDRDARGRVRARRVLHGFRLGYLFLMNHDAPTLAEEGEDCGDQCSMKDKYDLETPHQFLIGYELMARMVGQDWLNVVLVGNVMAAGLEQSRFFPSVNALIGFELDRSFQIGVGANLSLEQDKPAHMIIASGWTPDVGGFYVPVHAFFIPDVDDNHRVGMTVGVNW